MGLFDHFRRKPAIRDAAGLAEFIDAQAAFLVQKGIYDYVRARTGPHAKWLLQEGEFQARIDESRWRAYPMGLAMVGEMVDQVLYPFAGGERRALLDRLIPVVMDVFDRHPVPPSIGPQKWRDARERLARRLDQIGTHPPKRIIDIPEQYAATYFNLMPFDKEFLTQDEPTTLSYLKLTLARMHTELTDRMDAATMATELRAV
jgi:hypothetical protein